MDLLEKVGYTVILRRVVVSILCAVVLVLLGLTVYTQVALRHIRKAFPPTGQFVSADGIRLHYVREGSGRPVVMLHGRDGALQEYTFSILGRVAEHYDAIAFDRPGYGHSEWATDRKLSLEREHHIAPASTSSTCPAAPGMAQWPCYVPAHHA